MKLESDQENFYYYDIKDGEIDCNSAEKIDKDTAKQLNDLITQNLGKDKGALYKVQLSGILQFHNRRASQQVGTS